MGETVEWYQLTTPWACGGIAVVGGVVVEGAPIFRKLIRQRLDRLIASGYRVHRLEGGTEP